MTRILLADDHPIVVEGLKNLLKEEDSIQIVGEAFDGNAVLLQLGEEEIDLVILDIEMPGKDGIEVSKIIKAQYPDVSILILSHHSKLEFINHMLQLGVEGYMLKKSTPKDLLYAIKEIAKGDIYFHDEVLKKHIHNLQKPVTQEKVRLTKREIEILKLIADDHTTAEISAKLYIAESTVETHRRHLIKKTQVNSSLGLVRYAIRNGYAQ